MYKINQILLLDLFQSIVRNNAVSLITIVRKCMLVMPHLVNNWMTVL